MNILHIIDSGGLYGAEMVLLTLASEQIALGHRPCIASIGSHGDHDKPIETEARERGLDVALFRMRSGPNPAGVFQIIQYAHVNGFDILHTHGYKGDILVGFMPKCVRKLPMVSTVHGWTSLGGLTRIRLYEWADGLSLKHAEAVCLVNEAMLAHPRIHGLDPQRLHIIPNGLPELKTSDFAPQDEIASFCRDGYTIASIGRLAPEKGYDHLLQAFALIHERHADTRLLIVGEGPERELLEQQINRLRLHDSVLLPGYRYEAWRYLTRCRAFVLSSLTEGHPITLLEAMQVGIPVVATSVGGIPHVISHGVTGVIVPPASPVSLGNALLELYHEQEQAKCMADKARDDVMRRYSGSRMAKDYDAVYREVL